jgi:hypothetical protein
MIPVEDVPEKTDDEVWLRQAWTVSRHCRKWHTERNCHRLRKGTDADQEITTVHRAAVTDMGGECAFCDDSITHPQDDADQHSLAVDLRTGDDPQQVLENHDFG